MSKWVIVVAVAAGALLTGCGGSDPTAKAPAVPKSHGPVKDARYSGVTDLKDAAVQAGFSCPNWVQDNKVKLAAESGTCSDSDVFATFASDGDLQQQLDLTRSMNDLLKENNVAPDPTLVGPNWTILSPQAPELATKLGGTVNRD